MKCHKCGEGLIKYYKFCPVCGIKVDHEIKHEKPIKKHKKIILFKPISLKN
jgi:predicted amidophosphoribosyltransferase